MKACLLLPVAALLTLASCTSAPQHPTRTSPPKTTPLEPYDDPNLVLLAQSVEARRSTVNLGYFSGWQP